MEGILTEMRTKAAANVEMKGEQKAFQAGIGGEEKKECNTWGIFTILNNLDSMGTVQWEQRSVGLWGTQQRELLDQGISRGSRVGIGEARSDSSLPATMQVFQSFTNQCCCYCV